MPMSFFPLVLGGVRMSVMVQMIMMVVLVVEMRFSHFNMDVRMIVARMAMPYCDSALRSGIRVN
jgi:hypothetical protein